MKENNFGVNISGYINKQFGLGEGVRSNIRAIQTTNIPYVLNDFNIEISKYIYDEKFAEISVSNPYDINLIQINIDRLEQVIVNTDKNYFQDKYNIAFWAWELEEFPEESKKFFNLFNEIWVPSNFCAEAISKVSPVPVVKFMHSIEIETPILTRKDLYLPEDKFIFYGMFDYYSSIHRKNPLGTIEAYEKAFGKNHTETILLLKSGISTEFPEEKELILQRIADNKSIILIEELMDRNKLYSYMNACDAFVSLHRSEGFGLTMAEAMYFGKPVIATAYSANTEFMNINNSFLVQYKMVDTGDDYYFASGKGFWADPDTSYAAELMKFIFENPEKANEIGKKAQIHVKEILSPQAMGNRIKARLEYINENMIQNSGGGSSNKEIILEIENELLQKKIDKLKSYFPIKMKLAFKNLKNKLTGSKRKYMWE